MLGLTPGMWAWGLDLARFSGPLGWMLTAMPIVALALPGRAALERRVAAIGDAWMTSLYAVAGLCALAVALTLALPDRSHFVGDALLRAGRLDLGAWDRDMFPQAMPLDPLFHLRLPVAIARELQVPAAEVDRWLSALKAGLVPLCAVAMTRALRLHGSAAFAAVGVTAFPGALALFCGYSKAFVELSLLTAAFIAFGVRELEGRRGLVAASVTVALAFMSHRSAILLAPAWVALAVAKVRRDRRTSRSDRWSWVASSIIIAVAVVWIGPRAVAAMRLLDRSHLSLGNGTFFDILAPAFAPLRLLDLANVSLLLCPVLPLLAVIRPRFVRGLDASSTWVGFVAASQAVALFFIRPRQGLFRDWDVAASMSVTVVCACAIALGRGLSTRRSSGVPALAIVLTAAGATATWMVVNASLERSLARVEAYVSEPPRKEAVPLGLSYRYLGLVYEDHGMDERAGRAFERAATLVPSPSNFVLWAGFEVKRGRLKEAQAIYRTLATRDDTYASWLALARCSVALRDTVEVERAARRALALRPGDPEAAGLLDITQAPK